MGTRGIGRSLIGLGAVTLVASVVLVVWTEVGQRADEASRWAVEVSWRGRRFLSEWLGLVSVEFVAVTLTVAVLVALARRRVSRAASAVLVVAGSNVATQLIKALVPRPDHGIGAENTLPSGHTTVVTSLVLATLLVVPAAWRRTVVVLAAGAATLTGAATLVHRWHRPSDVVAAYAVCAMFTGAALLVGERTARVDGAHTAPLPLGRRRPGLATHLLLGLVGSALAGAFLLLTGLRPHGEPHDLVLGAVVLTAIGLTSAVLVALTATGLDAPTTRPARRRR